MTRPPAVVVHGLEQARAALAPGLPVTLLSGPGAALYAGCLWWRELVGAARRAHPGLTIMDILDCADAPGRALAALRIGQPAIVLLPHVRSFHAVVAIAAAQGGDVLPARPPALDLGQRLAPGRLAAWLRADTVPGDIGRPVG
jgi:hypothetical protein